MRLAAFKKSFCLVLAVLILFLTPACDYLDVRRMRRVDAASVAVTITGVSLLKLVAGAFGVVLTVKAASSLADEFGDWLSEHGDAESIETWNAAQREAQRIAVSESFTGKVRDWLHTKFDSLDSGAVSTATAGMEVTNGVACAYPDAEEALRAFVLKNYNYYVYAYSVSQDSTTVRIYYSFYPFQGSVPSCLVFTESCGYAYVLDDSGVFLSKTSVLNTGGRYDFDLNSLHGYANNRNYVFCVSDIPFDSDTKRIVTNVPVIITDFPGSLDDKVLYSSVLSHATATYNMSAGELAATSFGSYSDANVTSIVNKQLTAAAINTVNAAVSAAVDRSTTTDDDGNPVYAPDIAQTVIDAYRQGLEDAGGGTVIDPDQPVDPDIPVVPDTGILPFLQGLKDSLMDWILSVPSAVESAGQAVTDALQTGWTTLWEWLSDIHAAVTSGFADAGGWIMDIPAVLEGLSADLQEWITDIPAVVQDSFSDLHAWLQDMQASFPAVPDAGELTLPIVDAVGNVLAVDPAAVQEAIEAEKAELWDLPFLVQAADLFGSFRFSDEAEYPKIRITTPDILRPYYSEPEIILLDFEDYKDYCLWARLLFRAAIWLAFVWHVVDLATPRLRIS